eukprot:7446418-Alexandrium_andersonii.AAC.1
MSFVASCMEMLLSNDSLALNDEAWATMSPGSAAAKAGFPALAERKPWMASSSRRRASALGIEFL